MSDQRGLLNEGFRRVWHYQRALWFIFFINLVLSHFGAAPTIHKLDWAADHSMQSRRLTDMFDYGTFSALSSNPEVNLFEVAGVSIAFSIVFFVIVLFLTGGILEAYRAGRRRGWAGAPSASSSGTASSPPPWRSSCSPPTPCSSSSPGR